MTHDRSHIGRYEVITRLAIGGMAELFLAREQGLAGLERIVVLKRILPHLADEPRFVDMFLREARLVARLAHPNIVQIYDLGEDRGSYFIAMEYIHGTTVRELQILSDSLRESKTVSGFPVEVVIGIVVQMLRGLQAAHDVRDLDGKRLELVHRDISPHNVMCTTEGAVKLLDFGVAKATEDGLEATNSGNLKGKFAYMSPEQARRQPLDRRSDLFSAGIVAWEMLTGERLFKRDDEVEIMKAVLTDDVPPPSALNPHVPPAIDRVVLRALEREPDHRWSSADTMRRALTDAAVQAQLDIGPDVVARWVSQVAGGHLAMRDETLQRALEHSITAGDRARLLHVTGSDSKSADSGVDLEHAARVTRDAIRERQVATETGADEAGVSGETVVAKHRTSGGTVSSEDRSGRRLKFGALAAVVIGIVVALAIALRPDESTPTLIGEPIRIAWSPTVDPDLLRAEVEPLRTYLERTLKRPINLEIADSYDDASQKLLRSEVSFALLPPLMYVQTRIADDRATPIALKLFDGAATSDGLIVARGSSEYTTFARLNGKRFCLPDRNSTTGWLLPIAYIEREGYDPDEFIREIHWSGDHIQSIRDLLDSKCDAAAVYSGAMLAADRFGVPVSQLRQVAITGHVPQDPFVAGPLVPEADRRAMADALFAFKPKEHIGQEWLGDTQRITAFVETSNQDFDFLREIYDRQQAADVE